MLDIVWTGSLLDPSGYGAATRGYLAALDQGTRRVLCARSRQFFNGTMPDLGSRLPMFMRMGARTPGDHHVSIIHLTPENYMIDPAASYHIGMTTFETDRFPAIWQAPMRCMDELWTFSEFSRQAMLQSGVRRPVRVIPHGVDVDSFNPDVQPLPDIAARTAGRYVFGSNFEWTTRKNPEALVCAYLSAFDTGDPVALVIKAYVQNKGKAGLDTIGQQIAEWRRKLGKIGGPPIILIPSILSDDQMPQFYASLDCYVSTSRGEGWNLTLTEAMATGLPTIAVNWSAPSEYLTPQNSIPLDKYALQEVMPGYAPSTYVGHQWASVDIPSVAEAMRATFDDRHSARVAAIGKQARQDMVDKYTWKAAASAIEVRLCELDMLMTMSA